MPPRCGAPSAGPATGRSATQAPPRMFHSWSWVLHTAMYEPASGRPHRPWLGELGIETSDDEVGEMVARIDTDGSGVVSYAEFRAFARHTRAMFGPAQPRAALPVFLTPRIIYHSGFSLQSGMRGV